MGQYQMQLLIQSQHKMHMLSTSVCNVKYIIIILLLKDNSRTMLLDLAHGDVMKSAGPIKKKPNP